MDLHRNNNFEGFYEIRLNSSDSIEVPYEALLHHLYKKYDRLQEYLNKNSTLEEDIDDIESLGFNIKEEIADYLQHLQAANNNTLNDMIYVNGRLLPFEGDGTDALNETF